MRVCHTLICCFFLSVLGGDAQQLILYTGAEGGDVTVICTTSRSGDRKWFCKERCKPEDILIDTTEVRGQTGRFRLDWRKSRGSVGEFSVSIEKLRKSDSGLYRCGSPGRVSQVEVLVVDALLSENLPAVKHLEATSGGSVLVSCYFASALRLDRKYFCQDPCRGARLVSTFGSSAHSGRYSISYVGAIEGGGFLYVSITQLVKSDSGRYGCGLDKPFSTDPYLQFEVNVTDAAPTTPEPSRTSITRPSPDPPDPLDPPASTETPEPTKRSGWTAKDVLLFVCVTLVVMAMLSLCALMFYRKRMSKPREPPEETQYADITETSRVYENVMEDGQSRSSPVDLSSIYTYITYSGPGGAGTDDDYSMVNLSNMAVVSSSSDRRGENDDIIRSAPLVEKSREGGEEPPL